MKDVRKLFYKYLVVYFGLFLILVLGSFMIVRMTEQIIWDDLIAKEELKLEKGSLDFGQMIDAMRHINDSLSNSESIEALNKEKGKLSTSNFVEMNYVKKQFSSFRFAGGLPYGFVLFRDNPVFMSDSQVSPDYEKYYSQYMGADSYTAEQFRELVFSQPGIVSFIRLNKMEYYDMRRVSLENPVLVVLKPILSSGVVQESRRCVFVLPEEEILDYFLADDLLNSAIVRMYDSSGQVLVQHGNGNGEEELLFSSEEAKDWGYQLMHAEIDESMLSFYVGIPYGAVKVQVRDYTRGIYLVLAASVIYTVLAVVFLVWRRYKPTKRMLEYIHETAEEEVTASNEYEYVKNTVDVLSQTRKEIQRQFSELKLEVNNSILVNLLSHGIVNEADRDKIKNILPHSLGYYFVIVFHLNEMCEGNPYEVAQCLIYSFVQFYGEYIYAVRMNLLEEVFIVPLSETEQIDMNHIEERLKAVVHEVTRKTNKTFSVGISGIGKGIDTMNINYNQACQAYIYTRRDYENTVGSYSNVKLEIGDSSLEVTLLFQIYDFILMGNKKAIRNNLDRLVRFCERTGDYQQNKEFFYSLSRILSSAYETLGIEEEKEKHLQWNGNCSLGEQIEVLRERMDELIDDYDKSKKSHNTELKDGIIQYMEEHFQDANLTVMQVCEAMHISEKYLAQFLKEQTLKTFSRYLEELRINKAKEYLADTEWSNKVIAEAVGFGSLTTFYRVFNKVEGISPVNWKKLYIDHKGVMDKPADGEQTK